MLHGLPSGLWSDGTTMWVAEPPFRSKLDAYSLATRTRDPAKDFNTLNVAGNTNPRGLWSDGVTMWVGDTADTKLYAYSLTTKYRDAPKDFSASVLRVEWNGRPTGLWSDGTTMWVADAYDGKLYAYSLTTRSRDPGQGLRHSVGSGKPRRDGSLVRWCDHVGG